MLGSTTVLEPTQQEPRRRSPLRKRTRAPELGSSTGRYLVLEHISRGAMGNVLRAYDPKPQREVAIKLVSNAILDSSTHDRMLREARAMAQLSHPNVVAVYDAEESDLRGMLVMEYVRADIQTTPSRFSRRCTAPCSDRTWTLHRMLHSAWASRTSSRSPRRPNGERHPESPQ